MSKKLFANISLVVLLNVLVKPIWVLAENLVHDRIGHEAWGTYTALLSFAFLFITVSDWGLNQYTTKHLAGNTEQLKRTFPYLLSAKLLFFVLYPFSMVAVGWLWGYRGETLYLLAMITCIHGGNQLLQFIRANFQAMQRFNLDSFASIADKLILLALIAVLWFTDFDLEDYVYARLLAIGICVVIFYIGIGRVYGWLRPKFDAQFLQNTLKASFSFALIIVLNSIHDKVDQVMLEKIAGTVPTSLYAGAYRWLDAFSMYLWITLTIIFARLAYFSEDLKQKNSLIRLGQRVTALPMVFVCVFVFFYGEKLLLLFTHSSVEQIAVMTQSLKILFSALLVNCLLIIYSTLLTATGYVKYVNRVIIAGIAINIVLNLIFIPEYEALAAAWSTSISLLVMGIAYVVYVQRHLAENIAYDLLGKLILLGAVTAAVMYGLSMGSWPWFVNTGIAGVVYLFGAYVLKLIPRLKDLRK